MLGLIHNITKKKKIARKILMVLEHIYPLNNHCGQGKCSNVDEAGWN
jgi:hypothetical protein